MKRFIAVTAIIFAGLSAPAQAAKDVCFYEKDQFTIEYKLEGTESGTITEHVDKCGHLRVEVKNTEMKAFGITQKSDQRVVYDGDKIITIDQQTGQVTVTKNPLWDNMYASMKRQQKNGVEVGQAFLKSMGGTPTGEKGEFANVKCEYWDVSQLQSRICVTPWGGTLHSKTSLGGITSERTAISVELDNPGPKSAYDYDASKAKKIPSLGDLQKLMNRGR